MMPITRGNIEILLDSPAEARQVMSAFADLTVKDGFRDFFDRELRNEARGAAAALAGATADAREALEANIAEVRDAVATIDPTAKGAAIFVSSARGLRHVLALDVPIENRLVVDEEPFVLPLLELWYGEPSYLVAVVDSDHAQIIEARHGSVSAAGGESIPRTDVGDDIQRDRPRFTYKKRFAQSFHEHLQHADDNVYLKQVADALKEHWAAGEFQGLILVGRATVRGAFRQILPRELAEAVVEIDAETTRADHDEIAAEVQRVVDRWHDTRDAEVAADLANRRKEHHLIADGPTDVLDALQQGRAALVALGRRRDIPGSACRSCGYSFGAPAATCVYCGGTCRTIDATQDILRRALKQRVAVHLFRRSPGVDPLEPAGGVSALLRAGDNWAPGTKPASGPERTATAEAS